MTMENVYTLHSLSRMLQVSTRTIRREMDEGKLTFVRIRGRVRFRQTDVQTYLSECTGGQDADSANASIKQATTARHAG
jgi:excisionase family DNA binding protein